MVGWFDIRLVISSFSTDLYIFTKPGLLVFSRCPDRPHNKNNFEGFESIIDLLMFLFWFVWSKYPIPKSTLCFKEFLAKSVPQSIHLTEGRLKRSLVKCLFKILQQEALLLSKSSHSRKKTL